MYKMKQKRILPILSLVILSIFLNFKLINSQDWPKWLDGVNPDSVLCEGDNDTIGSRLGCSCTKLIDGSYAGSLFADCSKENLCSPDTQLPLKLNISSHVRVLDFSSNLFSEFNGLEAFNQVEGLYEISFAKNRIVNVTNLSFPRLIKLDLSQNSIANLTLETFGKMPKLENLDLSHNQIRQIHHSLFNQLSTLKVLNLGYNPISDALTYDPGYPLTLTNLTNLEELDLSNTSLPDFPHHYFEGTYNIRRLVLKNNLISFMPSGELHHLSKLEFLDLSGNLFTVISALSFAGLNNLRVLQLDDLHLLERINNHAFAGLTGLNELSCQRNHKLETIEHLAFMNDTNIDKEFGTSNPKIVRLSDNNLKFFDYPLLPWKDMQELELRRNPWNCDCNLRWVSEFSIFKPPEASILIDNDFVCKEPATRIGMPVASIPPAEMLCYSSSATLWGTMAIAVFCILISFFLIFAALHYLGIDVPPLVKRLRFFRIGTDSLPQYQRVHPKPTNGVKRNGFLSRDNPSTLAGEPKPDELEWDDGDVIPHA